MSVPAHRSQWRRGDETFLVSAVKDGHVKLVGQLGAVSVPLRDWPLDFVSTAPAVVVVPTKIKALLAGGAGGRHLERIKDIASSLGVDIIQHVPGDKAPTARPSSGVELVVALVSHSSHSLYYSAKGNELPVAAVTSDGIGPKLWAELVRLKLRTGIYPMSKQPTKTSMWNGASWVEPAGSRWWFFT